MTTSSAKVSVCMPVYNGARYVVEAIESVLGQTYGDFRLIVSDNGSTDNTEDIVRSFRDRRVRYLRNPENIGIVGNHNRCLQLAEEEYVCIFHHDDVMLPDNLERKVSLLDKHPGVGFVHSDLILIDEDGDLHAWEWVKEPRRDYVEDGLAVFHRYLAHLPICGIILMCAVLARREAYERVGAFNPRLPHCCDNEMWMRLMLFYKVACIGTPLVKYRVHSRSASRDMTDAEAMVEHCLAAKMVFDKHPERVPHSRAVRQEMCARFGALALEKARSAFYRGEYAVGRGFLKAAVSMDPRILRDPRCWGMAVRLAAGAHGVGIYRTLHKRLSRSGT